MFMEFQYIKLYLYKRFPLSDSDYFEHIFTKKVIQITGRNGSGKSSCFNELTPLPSDKNDFHKGGYKEIGILHNGSTYKIRSDFTDGASFSFICNEEELNISGIISKQRELVQQHFQLNETLHLLLTGAESFTNMSAIARKKLFSLITHLNIDDLLDYYNDIKNKQKVTELFLKSQTSLYHNERQKLLDREKIDEVKEAHTRIRSHIDILLEIWSYFKQQTDERSLESVYVTVNEIQNTINKVYSENYVTITSIPESLISEKLIQYNTKIESIRYQLDQCYAQLSKKQELHKVLQFATKNNLTSLQAEYSRITELISKYERDCVHLFYSNLNDSVRSSVYKIETLLPDLLYELPLNINKVYSKEKYEHVLDEKQKTLSLISNTSEEVLTLKRKHADITVAANVTCPNCLTIIKDETSLQQQIKLQEEIKLLETKQHNTTELLKTQNDYLQAFSEYMVIYRQIANIKKETHELTNFWHTFGQSDSLYTSPASLITLVKQLKQDLLNLEEVHKLKQIQQTLLKDIDTLKSIDSPDQQSLINEMSYLEHTITQLLAESTATVNQLKYIEQAKQIYNLLEQLKNKLNNARTDLYDVNLSYLSENLLTIIESDLGKAKINLIELERILHDDKSVHESLQKYEATINDTKEDLDVLEKILIVMSPKNGFIAKTVSGFLNLLITHINATINRVWSYQMTIKPIDVETDTLNYKFKVEIEGKHSVDDVSKISSGMKEIVNLSFRLMLYRLLGLNNYPVWMDELASAMDGEHTSKMSILINELIMSDRYSQLFLITHKESFSFIRDLDIIDLGS